ncbi:lung seven transmembrane receptor family protein [Cryptosporidium muris RN66]|uniref:Lung seven transmembrane receptor family protein n=1 Tax=Cryptosporidium muris (strain RN66) TaxID=441375 RepID=B6ABE0_CRYMR|nr:lung seven transmembrane receptor family protein [Cryptosporidium muris RN66]EEA05692.1 lung seven transmembrane receptor family protein [Cryptosporidium muris RN66]|eukprot:XP_002140041.1 lung seven transmembrane receptor family protein [Cryptosporidium muris RN66]
MEPPASKSLMVHPYQFFVYSNNQLPNSLVEKPPIDSNPELIFDGVTWKPSKKDLYPDFESMEITVLPSEDFQSYLESRKGKRFCCNEEDVLKGICPRENTLLRPNIENSDWFTQHMSIKGQDINSHILTKTGVYAIIISNCGTSREGTLAGFVSVKNAYGYLPATEYLKLSLYFVSCIIYALLGIYWIYKCLRHHKQLVSMQYLTGVAIMLGLFETICWFLYYKSWNLQGVPSEIMYNISTVSSILKITIVIMLTLMASLGVGVTISTIQDKYMIIRLYIVSFLYIAFSLLKEYVAQVQIFSNSSISATTTLFCVVPVAGLNGIIFFWVFHELSGLISKLKSQQQTEKLYIYRKFFFFLSGAVVMAINVFVVEIYIFSLSITKRWKYQWILHDTIPLAFTTFLIGILVWLWLPSENFKKYAAVTEIPIGVAVELESRNSVLNNKLACDRESETTNKDKIWDGHIEIPDINSDDEFSGERAPKKVIIETLEACKIDDPYEIEMLTNRRSLESPEKDVSNFKSKNKQEIPRKKEFQSPTLLVSKVSKMYDEESLKSENEDSTNQEHINRPCEAKSTKFYGSKKIS